MTLPSDARCLRSRAKRVRIPWLGRAAALAVIAAGTSSIASGCGENGGGNGGGGDAGSDAGGLGRAECPSEAPEARAACALPEGTTCAFGACGTRLARCSRGAWRFAENPSPSGVCPRDPPAPEAACPACWPAGKSCSYGSEDCTLPDASLNRATATCVDDRWAITFEPCRDAGPDVQDDAGEDAD